MFKPVRTLGHVFRKPKDRPAVNRIAGIVLKCHDCSFTYIGESKRSWSSRGADHDPGRASNSESAIKQHAESTEHNIHPKDAQILLRAVINYSIFLESWHSTLDRNAINERKAVPRACVPLIQNYNVALTHGLVARAPTNFISYGLTVAISLAKGNAGE